ncbi:MAG TPA: hypothetical protein VN721_15995 [Flavipsychrobacter sp.]|nr:hypothetical protein [Flavipsychrobacter sp.]
MTLSTPLRSALFVVVIHFIFVLVSTIPGIRGMDLRSSLQISDEATYVNDANNIVAHGAFSRETSSPYLWEPYRTPGLPLIIALSLFVTKSLIPILFINVLFAGLAAFFGIKLLQLLNMERSVQTYFIVLLAILPNALGMDCYILTDSIFAYLNIIWLFFLLKGFLKNDFRSLLYSSLVLAFAQLIKPTLSIAFIIILITAVIVKFEHLRSINFKQLIVVTGLSFLAPLFMSFMNYNAHHVFSPSLLGEETEREYLMASYISKKTKIDYHTIQTNIRDEDRRDAEKLMDNSKSIYGKLHIVKKQKDDSMMHHYRMGIYITAASEFFKQIFSPQEFAFNVFSQHPPAIARRVGFIINILLLFLFALGLVHFYKFNLMRYGILILIISSFYLIAGSLSAQQGARLRLPADIISLPVMAAGLSILFRKKSVKSAENLAFNNTTPLHR